MFLQPSCMAWHLHKHETMMVEAIMRSNKSHQIDDIEISSLLLQCTPTGSLSNLCILNG